MVNIREVDYVCTPPNISIKVKYLPHSSGNKIIFFIDKTIAFNMIYRFSPSQKKEDFRNFVRYCCSLFFNKFSKEKFMEAISGKDQLKAKHIYETICTVYAKTGYIIWKRQH